jgi:hypothetical protein
MDKDIALGERQLLDGSAKEFIELCCQRLLAERSDFDD